MRKVILTVIAASTMALSGVSHAVGNDLENRLVDLCKAVKSDDRFQLMKEIKENNLNADEVIEGLVCNGEDAVTFAKLNGAEKTANLLIERSDHSGKIVVIEDLAKN